ncbi:MAG: TonB-dependent siderophore receptor [Cyanobacteria bacterium J06635_15]
MRLWLGSVSLPLVGFSALAGLPAQAHEAAPAITVTDWVAQAPLVQITDVRVDSTDVGLQVVLETAGGTLAEPVTSVSGDALVLEIPNAVLVGEGFEEFAPAEGIALVQVSPLAGDRVQVVITGTDAVPEVAVGSDASGLTLSVIPGIAQAGEADEAIQILVTGEGDEGYNPSSASTATRTDTPLLDIPQSIQIVPQQVIEDRSTDTVIESVETVSGVVYNGGFADAPTGSVIIRGFDQAQQFRNGFRDSDRTGLSALDTVERIEVLKGPASVLFGAVEPGGIINVVTRQPLSDPFYNLAFEAGNRSFYQPSLDVTGPLNAEESVLYRFIASYQSSDSFQDFADSEITTVAPSVAFSFEDRTNLNLFYEYIDYSASPPEDYSFLLSDGSRPSRSFYPSYPDFAFREFTTQKFGYLFDHEFSDNWQIRHNFSATVSDVEDAQTFPSLLVDDRFLELDPSDREFTRDNYYGNIDLLGEFDTGSISHQLLIGFDVNRAEDSFAFSSGTVPSLDLLNPNYDVPRPDNFVPAFSDANFTTSYGLYLQDQVSLRDDLKLLVGGRFDWVSQRTEVEGEDPQEQDDTAFSPRIGLVYQPSDAVSLYASYSRSFVSTFGSNPDGNVFDPSQGTQHEVGIKADFLESRLSTTLAAYHITKSNLTTTDPDDPNFSIQVGEQRSQGVELDVAGEIFPGWNLVASYAYTDAEITEDNDLPEGNKLTNVPEHQASLWTTYEIQTGDLEGLGFGLGLFYIGERPGDLENTFMLSDYFRTDAAIFYRKDQFNAAINFRNLFNTDYFRASDGGDLFLFRGEPFTVTTSIGWEF